MEASSMGLIYSVLNIRSKREGLVSNPFLWCTNTLAFWHIQSRTPGCRNKQNKEVFVIQRMKNEHIVSWSPLRYRHTCICLKWVGFRRSFEKSAFYSFKEENMNFYHKRCRRKESKYRISSRKSRSSIQRTIQIFPVCVCCDNLLSGSVYTKR